MKHKACLSKEIQMYIQQKGIRLCLIGVMVILLICVAGSVYAQRPKLSVTFRMEYTAGTNELLKNAAMDWAKMKGVDLSVDFISQDDVPVKLATVVATGLGPDILEGDAFTAALYSDALIDVDDVAYYLGEKYGGWFPASERLTKIGGHWKAIPFLANRGVNLIRTDLLEAAGQAIPSSDWTWEDLLAIAKKIKAATGVTGAGFALGHAPGDGNTFVYDVLWSYGGKMVAADGKTVALKSGESKQALKFVKKLYDEVMVPGVLGWDDGSNNRLFLAGILAMTANSGSVYWAAKQDNPYIYKNMTHVIPPNGPAGRVLYGEVWMLVGFKHTKYPELVKDLLKYLLERDQYVPWMVSNEGNVSPMLGAYAEHEMWKDPMLQPFAECTQYIQNIGYPGPYTREAGEANVSFILIDTFARVCRGMSVEDALDWAVAELERIYRKR